MAEPTRPVVRLCLDLNIWFAYLLSERAGRQGTACQTLVSAVRTGTSVLGPVQLVVSWGMLARLQDALERELAVAREDAEAFVGLIGRFARLGAAGTPPQVTLGGTGVMPLRDKEDAHVLETAVAGLADYLVTKNFGDFGFKDVEVVSPGRILEYRHGTRMVTIIHPFELVQRMAGSG